MGETLALMRPAGVERVVLLSNWIPQLRAGDIVSATARVIALEHARSAA